MKHTLILLLFFLAFGDVETLTATNGCDSTVTTHITVLTAAKDVFGEKVSVRVFPNPFSEGFVIEKSLTQPVSSSIKITDVLGHEPFHFSINEMPWEKDDRLVIDARNWLSGIYFIFVDIGQGQIIRKIIKR